MGATIVVGAFFGDSGKGKIVAHLCRKYGAAFCVEAGTGPSAGHEIWPTPDQPYLTRQIPSGWLSPSCKLRIGPGVLVDLDVFRSDLNGLAGFEVDQRVRLDYRCGVIEKHHLDAEEGNSLISALGYEAGTTAARADYIWRKIRRAHSVAALSEYLADVPDEINQAAGREEVVVEAAHGSMLSLYLAQDHRFTVSGNCTAVAAADQVGLNWRYIQRVILVVKAVPTRTDGGPLLHELSVAELTQRGWLEYGKVSGHLRRAASHLGFEQLAQVCRLNGPTAVAITFCDRYDPDMADATNERRITPRLAKLIRQVERTAQAPVEYLSTGKLQSQIIDLGR